MPAAVRDETTRDGAFVSTRWTMVLDAGQSQTPPDQALSALSELCRIYWKPIFLFLRRQGSTPEDAQDLTQGFFEHLIESRAYARADREKGRFRSFCSARSSISWPMRAPISACRSAAGA